VTGAIWAVAVLAFLSSTIATIGNFAMARDFPDLSKSETSEVLSDFLLDSAVALRYMQYKLMTNIFYIQSLVLWASLGLLIAYKFLLSPST
jgi:hypothetical protein